MSDASAPPSNRRMLWLVGIVCLAPFIASFVAYYYFAPSGRVNHGELMAVAKLPAGALPLSGGGSFDLSRLEGKWVYVVVDDGGCDAYCEKKLWQIRQVRKTQGKYPERIERVWLLNGGTQPAGRLLEEYAGTHVVNAAGRALLRARPAVRDPVDHIYLVDPLGNLVLRYPRDADPTRMRKDLERLLKVSRIG